VLTGQVNDVGAYTRTNVENSYRQGIEAEYLFKIIKQLTWMANATCSQNKVEKFEEYVDEFDDVYNYIGQRHNTYNTATDLAFSPELVASSTIILEPIKNLKLSFISKYVSKQYLDNTSNESRKLNAFFVNNIRMNYAIHTKLVREIGVVVSLNNIFNQQYESNGYTYSYAYDGKPVTENFYYPQAAFNFMAGLSFKF